jgi:hypothetical protein
MKSKTGDYSPELRDVYMTIRVGYIGHVSLKMKMMASFS